MVVISKNGNWVDPIRNSGQSYSKEHKSRTNKIMDTPNNKIRVDLDLYTKLWIFLRIKTAVAYIYD